MVRFRSEVIIENSMIAHISGLLLIIACLKWLLSNIITGVLEADRSITGGSYCQVTGKILLSLVSISLVNLVLLVQGCTPKLTTSSIDKTSYDLPVEASDLNCPRPTVAAGHSRDVNDIAITSDGKYFISAGEDWSIILWDVLNQRPVRRFVGHKATVTSVDISPDDRYIVSGSLDKTIRIWELRTGKEVQRMTLEPGAFSELIGAIVEGVPYEPRKVFAVVFAPNGRHVLCSSNSGIVLIDWQKAELVRVYEKLPLGYRCVALSRDGRYVVAGIYVWEVETGRRIHRLENIGSLVTSVAIVPPDNHLLLATKDGVIRMLNMTTGEELRRYVGHTGAVRSLAVNQNGTRILSGSDDKTLRLWDSETGQQIHSFRRLTGITAVAFYPPDPDNRYVFSAEFGGAFLWSIPLDGVVRSYRGDTSSPPNVTTISGDGRSVLNGSWNGQIICWDLKTGQQLRDMEGHESYITALSSSSDGKWILSASDDKTIRLWDAERGSEVYQWTSSEDATWWVAAFSPNDRFLLLGCGCELSLWDIQAKMKLRSFGRKGLPSLCNEVVTAAFSPDNEGKYIAGGYFDWDGEDRIRVWETETGKLVWKIGGAFGFGAPSGLITSVEFTPNSKYLITGSKDKTIRIWDLETGKEKERLKTGSPVKSITCSPYGKYILVVVSDKAMQLWDANTGELLHELSGHWAEVESAMFIEDGRFILSSSRDGTQRIWDVESCKQLAVYTATYYEKGWLVYTPEGYFDGSSEGWRSFNWSFDRENSYGVDSAPVEIYFNDYFYPNLLADIFSGKRPIPPRNVADVDRRQPTIDIKVANVNYGAAVADREISVSITVEEAPKDSKHPTGSGARDVRLFRNGSLVKVWPGDVLGNNSSEITLNTSIPIVTGDNEITAYAFSHDNIKSEDATILITGADSLRREGKAYIIAIGINRYSNDDYNLNYAGNDAKAIAEIVGNSLKELNVYAEVVPVMLLDKDATKRNILISLDLLSGERKNIPETAPKELLHLKPAEPEDVVIVYFSGHGIAGKQGEEERDRYYLIPHDMRYKGEREKLDEIGFQLIMDSSVSDQDLEKGFEKIDAGHIMLIVDACQSGQALESEEKRRGPMNSRGLAQLAYEKGMYILAAAQSYQAALEIAKLEHGLLTHTLIEQGLKKMAADGNPNDGQLTAREWLDYAVQNVPKEMNEAGEKHLKKTGKEIDFGEPTVTGQAPRAYYRREIGQPWVVGEKL